MDDEIGTRAALELVGLDPVRFSNSQKRHEFTAAPPAVTRNRRSWSLDDIVALKFYAALIESGAPSPYSGSMADQLRDAMRAHPDADVLGVYAISRPGGMAEIVIRPAASDIGRPIFELPVNEYRAAVREALQEHFGIPVAAKTPSGRAGSEAGLEAAGYEDVRVRSAARTFKSNRARQRTSKQDKQ